MAKHHLFKRNKHSKTIETLASLNQQVMKKHPIKHNKLSETWMLSPKLSPVKPSTLTLSRRTNDVLAATYCGYVALLQDYGDDAVNHHGHTLEVKLPQINSQKVYVSSKGNLKYNNDGSLRGSINTIYEFYKNTDLEEKSQDTALVLWSEDHECFITGFLMDGNTVLDFFNEQKKCIDHGRYKCTISLSKFLKHGQEIKNQSVPMIGYELYEKALHKYVLARDGYLNDEETMRWLYIWKNLPNFAQKINKKY